MPGIEPGPRLTLRVIKPHDARNEKETLEKYSLNFLMKFVCYKWIPTNPAGNINIQTNSKNKTAFIFRISYFTFIRFYIEHSSCVSLSSQHHHFLLSLLFSNTLHNFTQLL